MKYKKLIAVQKKTEDIDLKVTMSNEKEMQNQIPRYIHMVIQKIEDSNNGSVTRLVTISVRFPKKPLLNMKTRDEVWMA